MAKRTTNAGPATGAWGKLQPAGPDVFEGQLSSTPNGNVLSLLFTGFAVDLQGPKAPGARSLAWSARVPVNVPAEVAMLGYVQDLRFHVSKSAGAGVLVVGDFGGTPLVVDLPAEEPAGGTGGGDGGPGDPSGGELHGPGDLHRGVFTLAPRGARSQYDDPAAMPAVPPYALTLLICVRRRSPADVASVSIDSLDVRVVTEPDGKRGDGPNASKAKPKS